MKYITLIIVLLVGFWVGFRLPKHKDDTKYQIDRIVSKIDTVTLVRDSLITKTNIKLKHDTLLIPTNEKIDTEAILRRFYAVKSYSDSVGYNNNWVLINDTVTQNKLTGRSVKFHVEKTIITKKDSVFLKPKFTPHLFINGGYNFDKTINVNLTYIYNNVGVTAGINSQGVPNVGVIIKLR